MKTRPFKTVAILMALFLFLPGCLDIYLTTELFRNGEVEKTVVIKGDSAKIYEAPFYFMQDSGWSRKWIQGDDNKPNLVMSKRFTSAREMNRVMNPEDSTIQTIRVQSELKRKFRWFFTYFQYSETIHRTDPYKTLDWRDFLTEKELRLVKIADEEKLKSDPEYDSVEYEKTDKKLEEFIMRSAFEDYYRVLMSVMAREPGYTEEARQIASRKEELYHFLIDSTGNMEDPQILDAVGRFSNQSGLNELGVKYPEPFQLFNAKMEFWGEVGSNSYKFIIRMPGLLLSSSSAQVQGRESRWEFTADDIYFEDTLLTCESRVINRWAFIVSGVVIILAIIALIVSVVKRTRQASRR